jgi:hypothetical protein
VAGSSSLLIWFLPLLDLYPLVDRIHILLAQGTPTVRNQSQGSVWLRGHSDGLTLSNQKEPTEVGYCF